ncbi:MAG: protein translocase subunit SecD [bacterium]|nr:protein translocase subunit SecD [bacterium]
MAFFQKRASGRMKLHWTVAGVVIVALAAFAYDSLEVYNDQRSTVEERIRSLGLKNVSLPAIHISGRVPEMFRLGLDLKGGTHLVYEADLSKTSATDKGSALEGVRDVIERRVNLFGVAEPIVQTVKVGESHRIIVELAGVKDVNQAIRMIGDTPLLEFKEENPVKTARQELTSEEKKDMEKYNADARKRAEDLLKKATAPTTDFTALAKEFSEDVRTKETGGDLGWLKKQDFLYFPISQIKKGEVGKDFVQGPDGVSIVKVLDTREDKELAAHHILICYKGATRCEKDMSKSDAQRLVEDIKKKVTPENFIELAKQHSTEPGASQGGGDLGWFGRGAMVKSFEDAAFALAKGTISDVVETEFGFHLIYKKDERLTTDIHAARILVKIKTAAEYLPPADPWKDTGLTGKQLKRAYVQFDQTTQFPEVGIEFNDDGKKLFADLTGKNVGKPIAIFLDGQPISIPRVSQLIADGRAVITGDFTVQEAKLLSQRLTTGALPVPINLISQQTVGPSLGLESLQKSLVAGLFGFLLVALFMIGYYRLPGVLAVVALCMYTALTLAIFKIWPVTLSIAGIAGFILSIGMAVDANVLIFERMKEELRNGKSLDAAIKDGFRRAWTSIRDSNASSLITCTILFWFSASLIKGFALTLAIGILMSMFSAIFITRILLRLVSGWRVRHALWLFTASKHRQS